MHDVKSRARSPGRRGYTQGGLVAKGQQEDDQLPDHEIAERMERALRNMANTPRQPHTPKPKQRPASKGRVKKGRSRS
jgi:hypothetical protein